MTKRPYRPPGARDQSKFCTWTSYAGPPAGRAFRRPAAADRYCQGFGEGFGPLLLLFDEPLVNLDYKLREDLREELQDIFQPTGGDRGVYHHGTERSVDAGRQISW